MNTETTNKPISNSVNSEQDYPGKTNEDNKQTGEPNMDWVIPAVVIVGGLILVCQFLIGWGTVFTILLWLVMVGAFIVAIKTGRRIPVDDKLEDWIVPSTTLLIACGALVLLTNEAYIPPDPLRTLADIVKYILPEKYKSMAMGLARLSAIYLFAFIFLISILGASRKRGSSNQTVENNKQNDKKKDNNISKTAVEKKVLQIISKQFETSLDQVQKESLLTDDLKASSLGVAKFALELQNQFGIEIPDEEFEKIKTVGDAITCVQQEIKNNS